MQRLFVSIPQRKIQECGGCIRTSCRDARFHSSKEDSRGGSSPRRWPPTSSFPFLKGRFKSASRRGPCPLASSFHSSKEDSRGYRAVSRDDMGDEFPFLKGRFKRRLHVPVRSTLWCFHSSKEDSRGGAWDRARSYRPEFPFLKGRFKREEWTLEVKLGERFPFLKGRFKRGRSSSSIATRPSFPFLKGRFKRVDPERGYVDRGRRFHSSKEDSRGGRRGRGVEGLHSFHSSKEDSRDEGPPSEGAERKRVSIPQRKIQERASSPPQ